MKQQDTAQKATFADVLRPYYRAIKRRMFDMREWKGRTYAGQSPKQVKDRVLLRNAVVNGKWVETGTFLGETTALLAKSAPHVYSLEPAEMLFQRAVKKFAGDPNVTIINGPSETEFPKLLPTIAGPVNFWLDGHFSAGATFQGNLDTPIIEELACIEANIAALSPICVMVDDIRCFDPSIPEYSSYPPLDVLVDWSRKNGLRWHIEHDIFIARTA